MSTHQPARVLDGPGDRSKGVSQEMALVAAYIRADHPADGPAGAFWAQVAGWIEREAEMARAGLIASSWGWLAFTEALDAARAYMEGRP